MLKVVWEARNGGRSVNFVMGKTVEDARAHLEKFGPGYPFAIVSVEKA